jgi:drug/metabolite transporter (DMT)-like permease
MASGVGLAALAAVTFGVTTPLVARASQGLGPLTVAAALYLGAAAISLLARPFVPRSGRRLARTDTSRLGLVVLFGAVLAPTFYVAGLGRAGPTATSLVLNFEAVFTAGLAWVLYREPIGRRVGLALLLMLAGGALVAGGAGGEAVSFTGVALVVVATAGWAADNTLSRGLAEADPLDNILAKGGIGGLTTGALAVINGDPMPSLEAAAALLALGASGYGLSLRFYLLAQRRIGAARTGSVFAAGPFLGAGLGWVLGDRGGTSTWLASAAFFAGVVLHATERHAHPHGHEEVEHHHAHDHRDGHHDHQHEPRINGEHTHAHVHAPVTHEHEHAPDLHHGHSHGPEKTGGR